MAAGMAVLAVCPAWSDSARLVRDNDAGWVVNNSPYENASQLEGADYLKKTRQRRPAEEVAEEFLQIVRRIAENPAELWQKRLNARRAAVVKFGQNAIARRWQEFLGKTIA